VQIDVVSGQDALVNTASASMSEMSTLARSRVCRSTAASFRSFICKLRVVSIAAREHLPIFDFQAVQSAERHPL